MLGSWSPTVKPRLEHPMAQRERFGGTTHGGFCRSRVCPRLVRSPSVRNMNTRVEIRGRLGDEQVTAVLALVEAATESDGVRPLNEHVMLHLRYGGDPGARAVLLYEGA